MEETPAPVLIVHQAVEEAVVAVEVEVDPAVAPISTGGDVAWTGRGDLALDTAQAMDPVPDTATGKAMVTDTATEMAPAWAADRPRSRNRAKSNSTKPRECSKCIPMATDSFAARTRITLASAPIRSFQEP